MSKIERKQNIEDPPTAKRGEDLSFKPIDVLINRFEAKTDHVVSKKEREDFIQRALKLVNLSLESSIYEQK